MSSTKVDYVPLGGGLDLVSGALNVKPGRLSECRNFEQVFGKQGYRRIDGYERFDGRPEPHKAAYYLMQFSDGLVEIEPGDVVAGAAASAEVLAVELASGAWGLGAVGRLVVMFPAGTFVVGEALKVGAVPVATVASLPVLGSVSEPLHGDYLALARESLRSAIEAVPGSGPVRGLAVFLGDVYAARDAADGKTAALYRSSPVGWLLIRSGLLPGGRFRFVVGNFGGATDGIALFGVDGRNRPFRWDNSGFTSMGTIYGSEATSVTSLTVGMGAQTISAIEATRSWAPGEMLLVHRALDAGVRMVGTVTSYSGSSLVLDVIQTEGSGTFTDWVICRADFRDRPYLVADHKEHLFLAYPKGQLQSSNLGDPMTYTTTAASFGMGDEITGITSMRGAVLGVFCLNGIDVLSGSSSVDWELAPYSRSAGAKHDTVQEMSGNALFLDDRGLTSLQATQNFGDFEPSIFSRDVKPLLDGYTSRIVGSRIAKTKFQYRLYADNGVRLTAAILSPEAAVQPGDVAFTLQQYPHAPVCVAHGDLDDGSEGLFFGTADGLVMREDVGASFDGDEIYALIRLHFHHLKSPANKKRFRKIDVEMDSPGRATLYFKQRFDYADGEYATGPSVQVEAPGSGGQWNASDWDRFFWSMPSATRAEAHIDGVGRNMGLLLFHVSDRDEPFTLQGFLLQYTILGLKR